MSVKKNLILPVALLLFWPLIVHTQPQVSDLSISGRGDVMRARADLTDSQSIAHREVLVEVAGAGDYRDRQLQYNNFVRELKTEYKRKGTRKGEITLLFPYEPVEDVDILLRVEWSGGTVFYHWPIDTAEMRRANSGEGGAQVSIWAPISAGESEQRKEDTRFSAGGDIEGLRVDTVRGDTWWNLANTVRQAYLRQEPVNTEQVMLALRSKNPDAFVNDAVMRVGISLVLPSFYEIRTRNGAEARAAVKNLLARRTASRPRIELAASEDVNYGGTAASEESDAAKREEGETLQKLAAVNEQLEQVRKLINLKEQKLASIEEVAAEEVQDLPQLPPQPKEIKELLLERAKLLGEEILANPRFWSLIFWGIFAGMLLLFYLSRLTYRHRRSAGGRAALMRNLRRSGGRSGKTLFHHPRFEPDPDTEDEDVTPPISTPKRKSSQSADRERVQDNLTSANLDLARAYINMGEGKKARALLEEVVSEGSAAEKTRAKDLLNTIKD